jgi:oxygen-independent coproporphyrinogen-3 oxidase
MDGLYFHIPYCKNKCRTARFTAKKYCREEAEEYAEKLIAEMQNYDGCFDSVYFGGGTPSAV